MNQMRPKNQKLQLQDKKIGQKRKTQRNVLNQTMEERNRAITVENSKQWQNNLQYKRAKQQERKQNQYSNVCKDSVQALVTSRYLCIIPIHSCRLVFLMSVSATNVLKYYDKLERNQKNSWQQLHQTVGFEVMQNLLVEIP